MDSLLSQLKKYTVVVADTGEISAIKEFSPEDATTNPSLILNAINSHEYDSLLDELISQAEMLGTNVDEQVEDVCDRLIVCIGAEILKLVPGRISTEVDAKLSFDTISTIAKARKLICLYEDLGVSKDRVLIKIAATWEGIRAAEQLEKEGINCNLTLLFSFAQARACAEANVYLISPFVGRILDWYKKDKDETYFGDTDPGVKSVKEIFNYYKKNGYNTIVMGASFRNVDEIISLAGCDKLTISPDLLKKLEVSNGELTRKLFINRSFDTQPTPLTESEFRWLHNEDTMATEKLAEGIRNFEIDQMKLEKIISSKLMN